MKTFGIRLGVSQKNFTLIELLVKYNLLNIHLLKLPCDHFRMHLHILRQLGYQSSEIKSRSHSSGIPSGLPPLVIHHRK